MQPPGNKGDASRPMWCAPQTEMRHLARIRQRAGTLARAAATRHPSQPPLAHPHLESRPASGGGTVSRSDTVRHSSQPTPVRRHLESRPASGGGTVARSDTVRHASQPSLPRICRACRIVRPGRRETTLAIVLGATILVAVDTDGIRPLLSCHGFVPTRLPTSARNRSSVSSIPTGIPTPAMEPHGMPAPHHTTESPSISSRHSRAYRVIRDMPRLP